MNNSFSNEQNNYFEPFQTESQMNSGIRLNYNIFFLREIQFGF